MISGQLYLAYLAACVAIAVVPGPTVTLIIANSLSHGARAGLANVAGTQLGLALMMGALGAGLVTLVQSLGWWFEALRFLGAAYLVWIGVRMLRSRGRLDLSAAPKAPRGGFFLQGLLVILTNPKVLVFFGAFIPQFIDPGADAAPQVLVLGLTAMAVALVSDGAYAVLTGRAGALLTRSRVRLVSRLSGACLVAGGLWLALMRAR